MNLKFDAYGALLVIGMGLASGCGEPGASDDDATVSELGNGDDDTVAGDDDETNGDDDSTVGEGSEDDDSGDDDTNTQVLPDCPFVSGDGGGVVIGLQQGNELILNRNPLLQYAFTRDVEVLSDGATVLESFETTTEGGEHSALYRSYDSGCEFEEITDLPGDQFREITIDPSDPKRIFLTSVDNAQLIRSDDGGVTWGASNVEGEGILAFAVNPSSSSHLSYVSANGNVFLSSDDGETWERRAVDVPSDCKLVNAAFSPEDPAVVIVGTDVYAWYRSDDGGQSWSPAQNGLYREGEYPGSPSLQSLNIAFSSADASMVYAVLNRTSGGGELYRSTDRGNSWVRLDENTDAEGGLVVGYDTRVYPDPVDPELFYTWYGTFYNDYGTDLYVCRVVDGTLEVSEVHFDFYDIYSLAFHPLDPTILYIGRVNDSPQI